MDAIAQNLANMNTTGFRGERVMFAELVHQTPAGDGISYVRQAGLHRDMTPGRLEQTENDLDLALDGPGYFAVEDEDGNRYYTRQGHFELDGERNLITSDGHQVLNLENLPITFAEGDAGSLTVSRDGTISSANGFVGRVRVVQFENEQSMQKAGSSLLMTEEEPTDVPNQEINVTQGMLEASNIEPILEMTRMIDVMRSYQRTQRMMSTDHDLRRRAIREIASTN